MNRMLKTLFALVLVLCLCLGACSALAEAGDGIMYRVLGGKNQMTLLGSIHIGSDDMYPMGDHILTAIEQADVMVYECDTESTESIAQMLSLMYYPAGETLEDHVSPETYAMLEMALQKTSFPIVTMRILKPWAVVSALSMESASAAMGEVDLGRAVQLGVEMQVMELAGDKPVRYLETALSQLEVMDGFSPELQEYMLLSTCNGILFPENLTGMDAEMESWDVWWHNGDADAFAQSYLDGMVNDPEPELMQEYHSAIASRRNHGMALVLRDMLESDEELDFFVTVGLLHLVLPGDSVISELEGMGYTVERVCQ